MHVHVQSAEAEAKFWMEPKIELDENFGIPDREVGRILKLLKDRESEIRKAWDQHFSR
jgi:Domain of unknown function (DUF4160)